MEKRKKRERKKQDREIVIHGDGWPKRPELYHIYTGRFVVKK